MAPGHNSSAMRALVIVLAAKFALGNVWCESGHTIERYNKCPEILKKQEKKKYNETARKQEVCGPSDCRDYFENYSKCSGSDAENVPYLWMECETEESKWCKGGYGAEQVTKCPITTKEFAKKTPDENAWGKEWCSTGSCKDFLDKIVADCADATEVADYRGHIIQHRKGCGGASASKANGLRFGYPGCWIAVVAATARKQ
eukprot:TRINITY_DN4783_c0_g2_i1.p1 TRINITY_DN4783_c0_g2~~TRINITY_DN4783_c0_g2_i1.p1  ORF type:complete len:220 (-),score=18.80 TRINITY_DN4783_c0_g2_i1:166-768(-)